MAAKEAKTAIAKFYRGARQHLPDDMSASGLLHGYEGFVSKNASSVSQIESALRSLTYIIPGRFREAEIASESLHSGVQLLSMYHDSLLSRVFASLPSSIPRPLPSTHNRYTSYWTTKSPLYKKIAILLSTLQYTELLCEMGAKRRGNETRWRVVVLFESIKAICRLLLLRLTRSRPLVSPPMPEREADPRLADERLQHPPPQAGWDGMDTPPLSEANSDVSWTMPRTGMNLPQLPDTDAVTEYLLKKVLTADDIKAPKQLLHRLTTAQAQVAEIMWILRPLVYALLMQRYQRDRRSWTPWLVGVGMELASRQLAKRDFNTRLAGGMRGLTTLEREELKKRGWSMGWWAMRGAFYEHVTKGWINGVVGGMKGRFLLDMVGGIVEDYQYLWDEYYFSSATM